MEDQSAKDYGPMTTDYRPVTTDYRLLTTVCGGRRRRKGETGLLRCKITLPRRNGILVDRRSRRVDSAHCVFAASRTCKGAGRWRMLSGLSAPPRLGEVSVE